MASAADYVFNRAPTVADFPQANFNWLSNLPDAYREGQQYQYQRNLQTMFQTPEGQNALRQAGIDPNSLFGRIGAATGASGVAPMAGQLLKGQMYQRYVGGGDLSDAILGQESGNRDIGESTYGNRPPGKRARGPGQILPETWAQFAQPGEDIDNPKDNRAVSKRIIDKYLADYNGDAARAAVAYFSGPGNVSPPGSPTPWIQDRSDGKVRVSQYVPQVLGRMRTASNQSDQLNPTDRASVDAMYPGASQPGTGSPAPVEQPKGATGNAPFMASSSQQGAGPANIGGGVKVASTDTAIGTNQEGSPNSTAERASVSGGGTDTSSPPPPSSNSPNNRAIAQGPSPTTGQEGEIPAGYSRQAIANHRAAARTIMNRAGYVGQMFGKEAQEAEEKKAQDQINQADMKEKFLNEREQEQYKAGVERGQTAFKEQLPTLNKQYEAISKAGDESAKEMQKSQIAKNILSSPDYVSGFGEHGILNYRRIMAQLDPSFHGTDAQAQEVVRKYWSDSLRSKIQAFAASGVNRVLMSEVRIMEKANGNQENTVASNRTLAEIDYRSNQLALGLSRVADAYKGNDLREFNRLQREYIEQHPMFTKQEIENPKLLAAPEAPRGLDKNGKGDWLRRMGLKSGDAIRMPDGSYSYVK